MAGTAAQRSRDTPRSSRWRLSAFVLISMVLHGLLLSGTARNPQPQTVPLGDDALRVRIEALARRGDSRHAPHVLSAVSDRQVTDDLHDSQDRTLQRQAEANTDRNDNGRDPQAVQNYLRGILQHELSRYLRYPRLARERGWQGVVLVGVVVTPDGTLTSMRMLRSSGHSVLDEASLDGLSHVRSLPIPTLTRRDGPVEIILPIQFRLIDNT